MDMLGWRHLAGSCHRVGGVTMRLYGSLTKIDAEQRIVSGYASTEAVDAAGEIVLKSAIESALGDYLEYGNVREMHQLSAVGTAEEASVDDRGLYLAAKIVDDVAWGKVTSGVYKGFSIGGKTLSRDPDNKKIITKILLTEISLVDRPSNPEARFDVWKAVGLHDGSDLAKVIGERDSLAKQLAGRDRAITELADGIERTMAKVLSIIEQNARLKSQNENLAKRLAQLGPQVVVDNTAAIRADQLIKSIENKVSIAEAAVTELDDRFRQAGI
jgi:phage head maturation protease/regulator of replication initiation timing